MLLSIGADFLKVLAQSCATLFVVGCWLLIVDCCGKIVDCRMEEDHCSVQPTKFSEKVRSFDFPGILKQKVYCSRNVIMVFPNLHI